MTKFTRFLAFLLLACLAVFQSAHAVGPTYVNLVPITGLPLAATVTDSNYFYVNTASASSGYKRATAAVVKTYVGMVPYTFTDTVSGISTVVTSAMACSQAAYNVICRMGVATGTSNATTHVLSTLPAAIRPTTAQIVDIPQLTDNGVIVYHVKGTVNTDGTISLANNGSAWTASGTFTITAGTTFFFTLL